MKKSMVLAENKKTTYHIVVGDSATVSERHAAEELKNFLKEISGANFPVYTESEYTQDQEILVGNSKKLANLGINLCEEALGLEGFIIKTVDQKLVITGANSRGTVYAVYTFLEEYLGCRWFTETVSKIPKRNLVAITEIDDKQVPALEYRDPFSGGNRCNDWHVRNKSNTMHAKLSDAQGYKVDYFPFVHTFDSILPVEEYFDEHPEYFSEIDGVRVNGRTQLCLSNPEVVAAAIAKVKQWIKEHPKVSIVSVSQNDWDNHCQCEKCQAIDDAEESPAGSLITFLNKVAEAIEVDYPHIIIDTLAYQYTRKAPIKIRPRPNVVVRLCSIECCFAHPLSECQHIASFSLREWTKKLKTFSEDLEDWSKVSDRLHVWDYTTNFSNYISPFPNFKVLKPNIKFFIDHNVTGVFEEGNASLGEDGELNALRQYVLAKLLWNVDIDVDEVVNEFLAGVYQSAAPAIREYYDAIHKEVEAPDRHMGIYDPPTVAYLSKEMLAKANLCFDKAEMLADDDEILKRVKLARLSVRYVEVNQMPMENPERKELVENLITDIENAGFIEIWEGHPLAESEQLLRDGKIIVRNV